MIVLRLSAQKFIENALEDVLKYRLLVQEENELFRSQGGLGSFKYKAWNFLDSKKMWIYFLMTIYKYRVQKTSLLFSCSRNEQIILEENLQFK